MAFVETISTDWLAILLSSRMYIGGQDAELQWSSATDRIREGMMMVSMSTRMVQSKFAKRSSSNTFCQIRSTNAVPDSVFLSSPGSAGAAELEKTMCPSQAKTPTPLACCAERRAI